MVRQYVRARRLGMNPFFMSASLNLNPTLSYILFESYNM